MSGIYLHIPFCKQACHYCDFHFSTSLKTKDLVLESMIAEIEMQKEFLSKKIQTIYFGGGTPSILSTYELGKLLDSIHKNFIVDNDNLELTLEANPDDLTSPKLKELSSLGVNRLSIGLQSFHEPHLKLMNRAHNAEESKQCVKLAQDAGFSNLTIDLIYGIPAPNHSIWKKDLETALELDVPHISSYCLTVEQKTALGKWAKTGKFKPAEDEFAAEQFEYLVETLKQNGYEQYEISNFAKEGFYSKHNSAYWQGKPYLGIGPGAHSFDGKKLRQYNVSNNPKYYKSILEHHQLDCEVEHLTRRDGINEYLLTTLRTSWGCNIEHLKEVYQFDLMKEKEKELEKMDASGWLVWKGNKLILSESGKLFADQISSDLFL
ncbi:radical SAM family heme chaperone HemW [Flammeovirga sp. SJP92]|uniref:radical SAM family heme chaperone HemW n=1 Tax=Flammeovirga sp. SJP92 TaxID=1775430 RepID=UPI00078896B6|nr:radical SAM family heme chaperone HemW [Flammeovirga sp. SJP92]KXX67375.1 coproporphyrinogen III oxidase [Flammeovirga sp. SJP92]